MRKYLTKQILLTAVSVIGVFALFALLFGRYIVVEDDFFINGKVAFIIRSFDGNIKIYATEEETGIVRDWLTSLERTSDIQEEGWVSLNIPQIRIKTDKSTVFFDLLDDKIIVTIDTDFLKSGMDKWVFAKSNDIELTQRVFAMCYEAVAGAESTLEPVWLE